MADQNRRNEGRFRKEYYDEDQRWRRRDDEDDWRRGEAGERGFGRDEGYVREGRGGETERWEQGGYGAQGYGSERYSSQGYGSERYGSQHYGRQHYGSQRYGTQSREGQYGRVGTGTPQYGTFGASEGGRQGRAWQEAGTFQESAWQRGEHRGKGPKGYKRSDDRIREDVCDRLSDDDELDASEITVTVKGGEVTLEGTVEDRRAKQRAEDLAEAVSGVRDVDNKLRKNKGMLQEMSDRLTGSENNERGGHAGSGTKNAPPNAPMSR